MSDPDVPPVTISRTYHRPITMRVETVSDLPTMRDLPQETEITLNLKGNRKVGIMLIAKISMQILIGDFFAVTITGPS